MSGFHEVEAMVQRRRAAEEGVEVLRRRVGALNESRTGLASTLLELRAQYSALSKDNATMNASSQQSHEDMARAAEPLAAVEEGIRVVELFVLFEGGPRGVFNGSPTDGVSEGCGGHDRDGNCGRGVASVASVLAPEGGEEPVTSEGQSHSQAKVHVDDQAETSGTLPCLVDQARQLADKGTAGAAQAHQIVREGMHTHTLIEEEREMLQMYVAATTSAQTETQKHEAACKSAVAKRRQLEAELKSKREALALFRKEGVGGELGGSDKTRREALYHQASVAEQTARTQNESSKAADVRWRERKEAASQGEGARDQELGDRVRAVARQLSILQDVCTCEAASSKWGAESDQGSLGVGASSSNSSSGGDDKGLCICSFFRNDVEDGSSGKGGGGRSEGLGKASSEYIHPGKSAYTTLASFVPPPTERDGVARTEVIEGGGVVAGSLSTATMRLEKKTTAYRMATGSLRAASNAVAVARHNAARMCSTSTIASTTLLIDMTGEEQELAHLIDMTSSTTARTVRSKKESIAARAGASKKMARAESFRSAAASARNTTKSFRAEMAQRKSARLEAEQRTVLLENTTEGARLAKKQSSEDIAASQTAATSHEGATQVTQKEEQRSKVDTMAAHARAAQLRSELEKLSRDLESSRSGQAGAKEEEERLKQCVAAAEARLKAVVSTLAGGDDGRSDNGSGGAYNENEEGREGEDVVVASESEVEDELSNFGITVVEEKVAALERRLTCLRADDAVTPGTLESLHKELENAHSKICARLKDNESKAAENLENVNSEGKAAVKEQKEVCSLRVKALQDELNFFSSSRALTIC